jgi:hypothetical protein
MAGFDRGPRTGPYYELEESVFRLSGSSTPEVWDMRPHQQSSVCTREPVGADWPAHTTPLDIQSPGSVHAIQSALAEARAAHRGIELIEAVTRVVAHGESVLSHHDIHEIVLRRRRYSFLYNVASLNRDFFTILSGQ